MFVSRRNVACSFGAVVCFPSLCNVFLLCLLMAACLLFMRAFTTFAAVAAVVSAIAMNVGYSSLEDGKFGWPENGTFPFIRTQHTGCNILLWKVGFCNGNEEERERGRDKVEPPCLHTVGMTWVLLACPYVREVIG